MGAIIVSEPRREAKVDDPELTEVPWQRLPTRAVLVRPIVIVGSRALFLYHNVSEFQIPMNNSDVMQTLDRKEQLSHNSLECLFIIEAVPALLEALVVVAGAYVRVVVRVAFTVFVRLRPFVAGLVPEVEYRIQGVAFAVLHQKVDALVIFEDIEELDGMLDLLAAQGEG